MSSCSERIKRTLTLTLTLTCALTGLLSAQQADDRFPAQDTTRDIRATWRPLRVAKWSALLLSTGAVAYGFNQNRVADRDYEKLERDCVDDPTLCQRTVGGQYVDATMEARYQEIVDRDDRAKLSLLAGQVGLVASLVLFIFDLPDKSTPEDIPYDPKPLRFGLGRGGRAELKLDARAIF